MEDLVKVTVVAEEIGVTHKTVYNWINDGRLEMIRRGYVSRTRAWEVWELMRERRVEISYFLSSYAMVRDDSGRFTGGLDV